MLQEGEKSLSLARNRNKIPRSFRPYPHLNVNWAKPALSSCLINWLQNYSFAQYKPRRYIAGYKDKYAVNFLLVANVYVLLSFTQLLHEEEKRTVQFKSNLVYVSLKQLTIKLRELHRNIEQVDRRGQRFLCQCRKKRTS